MVPFGMYVLGVLKILHFSPPRLLSLWHQHHCEEMETRVFSSTFISCWMLPALVYCMVTWSDQTSQSFRDRLNWPMEPWAVSQINLHGLKVM